MTEECDKLRSSRAFVLYLPYVLTCLRAFAYVSSFY